jgi:hypothetical protein
MKRWWLIAGGIVLVLALIAGGLLLYLPPDHRTTFLIDASASEIEFRDVADAVGAAARNTSSDDALALRRFGGACDQPDNTAEVVGVGTGQADEIDTAAHAIVPAGRATLLSGILAAIDDFDRGYPFRGDVSNRVVVVARNGVDACGKDANAIRAIIEEHTQRVGVRLNFRFIAHQLTEQQVSDLSVLASAVEAQPPKRTKTAGELITTVKELSVPEGLVAEEVSVPAAPVPCDSATPEGLGREPLGDGMSYLDIKCRDRYVLARANTDPKFTDDMIMSFEFTDGAWKLQNSGTSLSCGTIPAQVWQEWGMPCEAEDVVCRADEPRITVISGTVDCADAIDIADRYRAAIDNGEPEGQGLFWNSGVWECAWPYLEGRSHAESPLACERTTDQAQIYIGE